MKTLNLTLLLIFTLLLFTSCKKDKVEPSLPAATMEGKNTFGAMVNGEVWVPKGRPSTFQTNLGVVYDPNYSGGSFDIRAYSKISDDHVFYEYFYIYMTQVDHVGVYDLGNPDIGTVTFSSENCEYQREDNVQGTLEIAKLDMQNGVIAGKFEFTLAKPGCDTIRVTEGRFDKKLF
ncbi:DUF6252 family protein [Pontibacter russatus]|uniref:DUF6252 family protein n=1 Tax=Pontibacter russatus TaxID=2694929 RepID=UPI00192A4467|nr:DUF6252 family protein [Pontibacter russatus]